MYSWVSTNGWSNVWMGSNNVFMRSLPKQLALKPSICWMHIRRASSPLTLLVKRGTFASSLSQREHAQKQEGQAGLFQNRRTGSTHEASSGCLL